MKKIKEFYKKNDLNCWLAFGFLLISLIFIITIKICGSSEIPKMVEKDGYCKLTYGEEWDYDEENNYCFSIINKEKISHTFTEEEFREICPRVKLFELRFYSDCFHNGDSRT